MLSSQEGNAGLERTVDWFDPERGLRDRGRAIRLPLHEGEKGSPRPTPPARRSPANSDATPALGNLQDARLGEEVKGVISVPAGPTCLDRPVGPAGEDSAEPGAMIADGSPQAALEERVVEAIEAASTSVALEGALHGLTQPEHTVIVLRHGIGGRQAKSSRTSPRSSA